MRHTMSNRPAHHELRIMQTPVRFHPFVGGVEKYTLELSFGLARAGHSVTVVCANEPKSSPTENLRRIKVVRLPYFAKIANTNICLGLFRALMREDFDLIHTHIPTPWTADISALVSMIRRKPLVITYHNDIVGAGYEGVVARLYNATLLRLVLRRAHTIVVTQAGYINYSRHLRRYAAKTEPISLGVSEPANVDGVTRRPHQVFFLSVLDRYHEYKGLDVLLEALQEVIRQQPDTHLNVGGEGELTHKYRALAGRLGIASNVTFLGFVPDDELAQQYASSAVFVLPSVNNLEGFGIVALEALSYGTPVITTDLAGSSSYISRHEAGIIIRPNDVGGLTTALLDMLTKTEETVQMGARGRRLVTKDFGWTAVASRFSDVYDDMLGRTPSNDRLMRILLVAPYFPPKIGGLENYSYNIATYLRDRGHRVTIVTSNHIAGRYTFELMDGLRVHRIPYLFRISNTPYSPTWHRIIGRIIRQENPDIINAHTPVPLMADVAERVRRDIPFVLTYHNDLVKSGRVLKVFSRLAYPLFMTRTLRRANGIIVTSAHYLSQSRYLLRVAAKASIVAPGVEHVPPFVARKALDGRQLRVLFIAQLDKSHRHKGLDVLLQAAAMCAERGAPIALSVVGGGNIVMEYRRQAQKLGLQCVAFPGYVDRLQLEEEYRQADVLALPSTDASEGFGMVILEAAAYGTPCIASAVGGIPAAVVDGQTGLLVEPGDPGALADAICRLQVDDELRLELGRQAHARTRTEFTWERQGNLTEAVFRELLNRASV